MMVSRKLRWLVLSGILLGTCGLPGFSEAADAGMHVDQVGYLNGYSKTAMVTDTGDTDFSLVDAKTGQTVYEGKLSAAKKDANASSEGLSAKYADGILTVTVPKIVEKKNVTKISID